MGKLRQLGRLLVPEGIPGFAAPLYDRIARASRGSYYAPVADEVAAEIEGGRILDVGTGPGYLPIELAKRRPLVQIDAIDLSGRMIGLARDNAREAGVLDRVHFERGDANRLRFPDNSYDLVVSTGVFHSWKQPIKALNELYRVLKPGGKALIYDPASLAGGAAIVRQPLSWQERLALRWVRLANWLWPRSYTAESVRDILGLSRFSEFTVSQRDGLKMRLRKAAG